MCKSYCGLKLSDLKSESIVAWKKCQNHTVLLPAGHWHRCAIGVLNSNKNRISTLFKTCEGFKY